MIEEFKRSYPAAYDRSQDHGVPPDTGILSFMARLREEPESDEGSSPDEGVPQKNVWSLWQGTTHEGWCTVHSAGFL